MTWFTDLTGLADETPDQVARHLSMNGQTLKSNINGREFSAGRFSMPQLSDLRGQRVTGFGKTTVCEIVEDVRALHLDPVNAGAVFQVASQFNMLEMVSPDVSPLDGVGIYEHDFTQGPACAIACGAGTILRNYFVEVDGEIGQTGERQLNGLSGIQDILDNDTNQYWRMMNGYVVPCDGGLLRLTNALGELGAHETDAVRGALQIGLHQDVEVTLANAGHLVTQIYCSALPVAYSASPSGQWQRFARLVLEAAYEATLLAACHSASRTGNRRVFLTLLGGGAFGNQIDWITDAAVRALHLVQDAGLDVHFVSYARSNPAVADIIAQYAKPKARR